MTELFVHLSQKSTGKVKLQNWKEHVCVGCDGVYAYLLVRNVEGRGDNRAKAELNLQTAIAATLAREIDMQPCPTCGLYQPDMIARRKAGRIWLIFWLGFAAFLFTPILYSRGILQAGTTTWILVAIGGIAALRLLIISQDNPNADLRINRELAQSRVAAGEMKQTPGKPDRRVEESAHSGRSTFQSLIVLILMGAVVPLAAPEIIRSSRSWPANKACHPPVVGPGDTTLVYMPEEIRSIKTYWFGRAKAFMREVDARDNASIPIDAISNQNDWRSTFSAGSNERNLPSMPWVKLTLPNSTTLAGKTVRCDIELALQYPVSEGRSRFATRQKTMYQTVNIRLAPPGAGATYWRLWWEGTLAGIAIILICSLVLAGGAKRFQQRANPSRIVG